MNFDVGDLVWLDARHINRLCPCPSFDFKHIGPFPVIELIGARSYRLELPQSLSRLRNVFNVDKLNKYTPPLQGEPAPQQLPTMLDDEANWPVSAILDFDLDPDRGLSYLVK